MNWDPVLAVWSKELRDTVRDRRTLIVMVVMPTIISPLLIVGSSFFMKFQLDAAAKANKKCLLVGTATAPELDASLRSIEKMEFQVVQDPATAAKQVQEGEASAAVVVGSDAAQKLERGETTSVTILYKGTALASQTAYRDLEKNVEQFAKAVVKRRLEARGVSEDELEPVRVEAQNVATKQQMGGYILGFIVPMIVLTWSIVGGMYTAMDVSAGEKERNTLESLLLTPATRLEVTLGKLFAVSTVGFFTMVAALGSMYAAFVFFPVRLAGPGGGAAKEMISFTLSPLATLFMLGLSVLLVVSFSSLMIGLGIFARSVKEAQNLITPLFFLALMPIVAASLMETEKSSLALFAIPGVNAVLLFKELFRDHYDWAHIAVTTLTLLVCMGTAIAFTVFTFQRETVLFKS